MVSLVDFNTAVRMREAMQQIATSTLEYMNPDARYATVQAINNVARTVTVKYPDESVSFTVPVGSLMPVTIGSLVRVAGKLGARYVDEVLDGKVQIVQVRLLDTGDATLTSTTHAFQVGASNTQNLIIDNNSIVSRVNGQVGELFLNPQGGMVRVGSVLGSGPVMQMGNDTYWQDVNISNQLGLFGASNPAGAYLRLGSNGLVVGSDGANSLVHSSVGYLHLKALTDMYHDGNTHYFRQAAGFPDLGYWNSGGLGIYGNASLYFPSWGGGWFMQDGTWLRSVNNKYIYTGGVVACDGGVSFGTPTQSLGGSKTIDQGGTFDHAFKGTVGMTWHLRVWRNLNAIGTDRNWGQSQVIVAGTGVGSTHSAMLALWVQGDVAGLAPVISCYEGGGLGEVVSITNSPNTGYAPVAASAYLTPSSTDTKKDIREIPERLIDRCRGVKPKTWKRSVVPQTLRVRPDILRRRKKLQQMGHDLPELKNEDYVSFDHDCSVDACNGTHDDPCSIVLSHATDNIGLMVEEVAAVLPEVVAFNEKREPAFLDVSQVASAAWGMVVELAEEVEALRAEIADLRGKK